MQEILAWILTFQAKRYLAKNRPKVVIVSGSVGKTSTTQAVATVLSASFKVTSTIGSYNTSLGLPCSIFEQKIPESLKNPFAWLKIIIANEIALLFRQNTEVLVLEVGSDVPGELAQFAWLKPDIAVVTAVVAEHMEYFKTLDAVAKEELSVSSYSRKVVINERMVDKKYLSYIDNDDVMFYDREDLGKFNVSPEHLSLAGVHSLDAVVAGLVVGRELGMSNVDLRTGAVKVRPQPGRMQVLRGIKNSTLIDDTYNANPEATRAALDYLHSVKSPQRIALLGNMNELGDTSRDEHLAIGEYCDAKKLDLIVTLGPDANEYLATSAKAHGCKVQESTTPYQAAEIIKQHLKEGACILLKGSQNGVFAEEAVKLLLENPEDAEKLVRQNVFWAVKKKNSFRGESA